MQYHLKLCLHDFRKKAFYGLLSSHDLCRLSGKRRFKRKSDNRRVRTLKLNEVKVPHSRYLAPNGQPLLSAFSPEVNEQSTICIARVFANVPFSRTLNIVQYITVLLNEKHNKTTARSRETELKKNLATSYCTYDRSGP